jgi:predicted nucleic acid-binding protein
MSSKRALIYWDSCVFIDAIQQTQGRYLDLRPILTEAENGRVLIVVSAVGLAEVNHLSGSEDTITEQAERIRHFFESDFIECWPADRSVAEDAAAICRQHGIRPADAIHVATALQAGCERFHTYDGQWRGGKAKRKKPYLLDFDGKIGNPPLVIETPDKFFQHEMPLFDDTEELQHGIDNYNPILGWLSRQQRYWHPLRSRGNLTACPASVMRPHSAIRSR